MAQSSSPGDSTFDDAHDLDLLVAESNDIQRRRLIRIPARLRRAAQLRRDRARRRRRAFGEGRETAWRIVASVAGLLAAAGGFGLAVATGSIGAYLLVAVGLLLLVTAPLVRP